jgi:hypothetical protein
MVGPFPDIVWSMKSYRSRAALLCLTFLATGLASASAKDAAKNAAKDHAASWSTINEKDQATLRYGDDSEESVVVFSCKPRSDAVRIFVGETDASLKPNEKTTAQVSAGSQKTTVRGRTVPNELAGVPSFMGGLEASDPLFAALTGSGDLVIKVAKSRTVVPLKSIGSKAADFSKACRKG